MTIQQFTSGEFDEQKANRHEVRQVLRVLRLSPEEWAEVRRQRAQEGAGRVVGGARLRVDPAKTRGTVQP